MDVLTEVVFGTYPSWSHLVVRVVLGIVFFAHGTQKLFGWFGGLGLERTIATFEEHLKVPRPAAVVAAVTETFGGVAMVVGFLARPAGAGLAVLLLVAIAKVHGRHGFFLNASPTPGRGHGIEYTLALLAMAVSIVIGGAGAFSVDRLIAPLGLD